uniref:Mitochondrial elongation factor 2 n=1 Tax=Molossus molossus TaxID=27622 RepID=A0A7J8BJ40_MOLMO|nr:mitochondrial elongation factor 2 [Molossus molossus]
MAEFPRKQGKRHEEDVLSSAVNFLLANARLVLGVGGAAVLGIATLAVKRVRPCWASYTWAPEGGSRGWGLQWEPGR